MNDGIRPLTITIDGQEILANPGVTILQAAQQNGIRIPTLCHHPALSDRGGCRLCVVAVDGAPKLAASCVTPVRAGMRVETVNERIVATRRLILEFLFAERNHNCMFCPKSGDCELQDLAYQLQMDHLTVPPSFGGFRVDVTSEVIGLDHNRCVLCGRCVRACEEISGCCVLNFQNRGPETMIGFDLNVTRKESACTSCGACLQVCPTGALYNRYRTHYAVRRSSEDFRTVRTVCPLCGLLCPTVSTAGGDCLIKIDGVLPSENGRPDGGQLCRIGRFGVLKNSGRRLFHPMLKRADGSWAETSWESALRVTAERLNALCRRHGGNAVIGLVSGLCSNEELVCFRDLMVNAWQAGEIALLEAPEFQKFYRIEPGTGTSFRETSWEKIAEADYVLVAGAMDDGWQPVVGAMIRKRVIRGNLPTASIGSSDWLHPYGTSHLRVDNGEELLLLQTVLRRVMEIGEERTTAALDAEGLSNREPEGDTTRKLHLDKGGLAVLDDIVKGFAASANPLIVVSEDIAARKRPNDLRPLVDLALLKGLHDNGSLRLVVLKRGGNSMGAFNLLRLIDAERSSRVATQPKGGLILLEQDPFQDPLHTNIPGGLDFLAAITPCRIDRLDDCAHVLIPKPLWMETDGSCTALNGRTVAFRKKVLDGPAGIKTSWQTLVDLAARANARLGYGSWEALRQAAERETQPGGPGGKGGAR